METSSNPLDDVCKLLIAFLLKIQLQVLHKQACAMVQGRWIGFVTNVSKSDDTRLTLTYWPNEDQTQTKRTTVHPRPTTANAAGAQKAAPKPAQVDICIEGNNQLMVRFVPRLIDEAGADLALLPAMIDIEAVMELVLSVHMRARSQSAAQSGRTPQSKPTNPTACGLSCRVQ